MCFLQTSQGYILHFEPLVVQFWHGVWRLKIAALNQKRSASEQWCVCTSNRKSVKDINVLFSACESSVDTCCNVPFQPQGGELAQFFLAWSMRLSNNKKQPQTAACQNCLISSAHWNLNLFCQLLLRGRKYSAIWRYFSNKLV